MWQMKNNYKHMKTKELIKEIEKLPVRDRIYVIERSMNLIRKQEKEDQMKKAADELYEDYLTDNELTAFTVLEFEKFYETRGSGD
jgi:tRNA(Ser,Leu) C12 N-acetylase TAN1